MITLHIYSASNTMKITPNTANTAQITLKEGKCEKIKIYILQQLSRHSTKFTQMKMALHGLTPATW